MKKLLEQSVPSPFYSLKKTMLIAAVSVGYLFVAYRLIGFRPEQVFLVILFNGLYFLSPSTRKFILGFSVFIIYWIIFDFMKAFPNYHYNPVHIGDIYATEKKLFGIHSGNTILTPNEYCAQHSKPFLNALTGFFYLSWVPFPLIFAGILFYHNRREFFLFAFTFLLVNLIGFVIYYLFPAAPPWYVAEFGFNFHAGTPGSPAGLSRFDQFYHTDIFKAIYAKSSNVFAAMPSLHSAYPLIVLYFAIRNLMQTISYLAAIIMQGIWFSAVYNSHHYVLDIIAGITCAVVGIILFRLLEKHLLSSAISKMSA